MRMLRLVSLMASASLSGAMVAAEPAQEPGAAPAGSAATGTQSTTPRPADRLIVSANGSQLEGDDNGLGGLVRWIHHLNAATQFGIGAEHQRIADADWTVGTLTGTYTHTASSGERTALFGEVTWGQGRVGEGDDYTHAISALGVLYARPGGLSLQLEDRQIDVDETHGNLPKLSVAYLWNPRLLTTVSYANTVSGNLGTRLYSTRIDLYGARANLLAGAAYGDAAPAVVNLQTGLVQPALRLRQGFLGFAVPFSAGEFTAVGDYLELGGIERLSLTLSCNFHLGSDRGSR